MKHAVDVEMNAIAIQLVINLLAISVYDLFHPLRHTVEVGSQKLWINIEIGLRSCCACIYSTKS